MKRLLCGTAVLAAALFMLAGCKAGYVEPDIKETKKITTITVPVTSVGSTDEDREKPAVSSETSEDASSGKIPESGDAGDIKYNIIDPGTSGEGEVEKGYYLVEAANDKLPYKIVVAMGEFSTGGYDIRFSGIDYDGTVLKLTVKETSPAEGDVVPQAITYPMCAIEFSKLPAQIKVVNESGYEYKCVFTRLETKTADLELIAWFSDGGGEILRKTYVYQTADGTYKYENVTSITEHWGAAKWKDTIESYGFAKTREEIVEIARKFHSCGYLMYPNDNKPHSPDEFLKTKT